MLKENQQIEIPWTQTAQSFYNKIGYNLQKGETVNVTPEELPKGSHRRVKVICDGCGKELEMEYRQFVNKSKKFNGEYFCDRCATSHPITVAKRKSTCMEKYGVDSPLKNKEIQLKARASLSNSGQIPTSSQQKKIYEWLQQNYNDTNLNFPCSMLFLDCVLFYKDIKIDIEYDCWYWHQDKDKDRRRDEYVKSQGYKILRIKSGHKLPDFNLLKESIDSLIITSNNYTEIVLEDYKEITNIT